MCYKENATPNQKMAGRNRTKQNKTNKEPW